MMSRQRPRGIFTLACAGCLLLLAAMASGRQDAQKVKIHLTCPPQPRGDDTSILLRHLVRESFLIAAWEDYGLAATDAALGTGPDPDAASYTLRIVQPRKEEPIECALYCSTDLDAAMKPNGDAVAKPTLSTTNTRGSVFRHFADLEKDGQTQYAGVFKTAGLGRRANRWDAALRVPADILQEMASLEIVPQFDAARRLHALLRDEGESPARLGALARCYANLYQVTRTSWSGEPQVFAARAILYGRRAVAKAPGDKAALWDNAYALAMIGWQARAADAIAEADALPGDAPSFAAPLRLFIAFDSDALADFAGSGADKTLATYFDFLIHELTATDTLREAKAQRILSCQAAVFPAYNVTKRLFGPGSVREITIRGERAGDRSFADALATLDSAPPAVRRAAAALRQAPEPLVGRAALVEALRAVPPGSGGNARDPLPWPALAQIIVGVSFEEAIAHANMLKYDFGSRVAGYLRGVRPVVESSPFISILDAYAALDADGGEKTAARLKDVDRLELPRTSGSVLTFLNHVDPEGVGRAAWRRINAMSNGVSFELEQHSRQTVGGGSPEFCAWISGQIEKMSPGNPHALVQAMRADWDAAKQDLPRIEAWAKRSPYVAAEAGLRYQKEGLYTEAALMFSQAAALSADPDYYAMIAECNLLDGRPEDWCTALETGLKLTKDRDLTHAGFQKRIAYFYSLAGRPDAALPYALATSGVGWVSGMRCEAQVREKLNEWDFAERLAADVGDRYDDEDSWLRWCVTTGHGRRAEAYAHADRWAQAILARRDDREARSTLASLAMMNDDVAAARERLKAMWAGNGDPWAALHGALLALEAGDRKECDAALEAAVGRGAEARIISGTRPALVYLAARVQATLHQPTPAAFSVESLREVAAMGKLQDEANVYYFAARFADALHDPKAAKACYVECLRAGPRERTNFTLAAARLRGLGVDPMPYVWRSRAVEREITTNNDALPWNRAAATRPAADMP